MVEEPLEIRVNGTAVTVTMRTPGSDIELAQGFLLTEGGLPGAMMCATCTLAPNVPRCRSDRNFYTTPSCEVCGKASLDAVRLISRHCPGDGPSTVTAETLLVIRGSYAPRRRSSRAPAACAARRCSTPRAPWPCARTSAGTMPSTR